MPNWLKKMFIPEPVADGPAAGMVGDPPAVVAIAYGLLAGSFAGPESTAAEKALFVATPFAITAAAVAGAQKGNEEFRN